MYKQQINTLRSRITAAVEITDYHASVEALNAVNNDIPALFDGDDGFCRSAMSYVSEALGDVCMKNRLITDAEKHYINMVTHSAAAYDADNEKHRYRHGFCFYRRACFYRTMLGAVAVFPKAKELTEQQKKIYEMAAVMYKSAIGVTYTKQTGISLLTAELHGNCMHDLLLLYCLVGDYSNATAFGRDGINIDSLVYGQTPDAKTGSRYAKHLAALASVYMAAKEDALAAETALQAAQIFEHHKDTDSANMLLNRSKNLTLAARCYSHISEKAHLSEQLYKDAIRSVTDSNELAEGKMVQDVIILYMLVGDYYNRRRKHVTAVEHYRWAYNLAADAYNKTKDKRFISYIQRLHQYMDPR